MSIQILIIFVSLLVFKGYAGVRGLAVVGPLTKSAFDCLKTDGYQKVIVRAFQLDIYQGAIDPHAALTLMNARAAGFLP